MRENISKDSLFRISGSFRSESDRSAAILAASLLDDQLKALLEKFLVPDKHMPKMFATYAPLSTFSAKFELAYLLALIPKDIRDDIDTVRKIRNLFAHRVEDVVFSKPPVSDLAMNLKTVQWFIDHMYLADEPPAQSEIEDVTKSARRRFEISVSMISLALDAYIDAAEPLKAKSNEYNWASQRKPAAP